MAKLDGVSAARTDLICTTGEGGKVYDGDDNLYFDPDEKITYADEGILEGGANVAFVTTEQGAGYLETGGVSVFAGGYLKVTKVFDTTDNPLELARFNVRAAQTAYVVRAWWNSQKTGANNARRQRTYEMYFTVTQGNGAPVVDLISNAGYGNFLSSSPSSGDRDPVSFDPQLAVDGDQVVLSITNDNTSGSAAQLIVAHFEVMGRGVTRSIIDGIVS